MDVYKAIKDLLEEKKRVEGAIAKLEEMLDQPAAGRKLQKQRGRKSMSPEERLEVSERMKRYWAQRKSKAAPETSQAGESAADPRASDAAEPAPKVAVAGSAIPES